ncbi:hypothetical protein [Halorubrum sp. HHNYT27]|uniref:hypothetical protein n=1 Tax=Halorubrum sp. HHNYT27 TaxID=3402275 RepID=UPI003EB9AA43
MASQLTVKTVEQSDDYYHVRFRDPDTFEEVRTPDWANNIAQSVVPESEVRMGQNDDDEWLVQSILVSIDEVKDDDDASRKALEIATKLSD